MIRVTIADKYHPPFTLIRRQGGVVTQVHLHAAPKLLDAPGGLYAELARLTMAAQRMTNQ